MSDQSLATLLAWLREESRMLGWDMIIAVERDKANLLLRHDYMARFDRGEYLEPISGSEEIVGNYWRGVLHDFIFDTPRLMFQTVAAPTPEDPARTLEEALLTMDLMSGALVSMENDNVAWRVRKLQAFDTLQANKLYLKLEMPQTLAIEVDGAIKLDFRFSQNFEMALTGDTEFNDQVSIAFRTLFHDLEDARRMYTLLVLPEGSDTSGHPGKIKLYAQANPDASNAAQALGYGGGALLIMANRGEQEGAGPATGFNYLIPDDPDKNYSMVVMFSHEEILRLIDADTAVLKAIMRKFGWDGPIDEYFNIAPGAHELWRAEFLEGHYIHEGYEVLGAFYSNYYKEPHSTIFKWRNPWSHIEGQTQLRRDQNGYAIGIDTFSECFFDVELIPRMYAGGSTVRMVVKGDIKFKITVEDDDLRLTHSIFTGVGTETGYNITELRVHDEYQHNLEQWDEKLDCLERRAFVNALPRAPRLYDWLKRGLENHFGGFGSLHPSVLEFMASSFDPAFKLQDLISPLDTACFGSINSDRVSFEITPHELIIAPGQPHTFTTTAPDVLVWAASNIDPTSSAPPGGFGPDNTYWAPPLVSIKGNHTRVRVSATQGDATAHALITVAQPLSINPLVATCDADMSGGTQGGNDHIVELFAALMQEEGARITWTIKNAIEGESGSLEPSEDGHTCTFTAHPFLEAKKCVLDEVEVKVEIDEGGQIVTRTRQALVLASHVGFTLNIHIAEAHLAPDTLKLIARLADTEGNQVDAKWRLADQSPGHIGSEDGIYVPDPERPEKFALIFAAVEGRIKREGYLILPLPYLDFPEELILFSQPLDLTETTVTPTG